LLGVGTWNIDDTGLAGDQDRLSILQVCRQTHREAFLLPFTLNVFEFGACTMDSFIDGLTVLQRSSITRVTLDIVVSKVWNELKMDSRTIWADDLKFLDSLSGLKALDLVLDVWEWGEADIDEAFQVVSDVLPFEMRPHLDVSMSTAEGVVAYFRS
jgi:hypothetical protein